MVRPDRRGIDPARWSPQVVTLLQIAAGLPDVGPHPDQPGDQAAALPGGPGRPVVAAADAAVVRPRSAHCHIRFRCPAGQAECVQAPPPPAGDGCDATLQWWFDQLDAPPKPPAPPSPPPRPPVLPAACKAVMAGP
ncbi:MAG: penicillin-insensitive murein endopeptidase [Acetobacteraceae bacterium]